VKEETARGRPIALDRPLPEALPRLLVPAFFIALALLVTTGYGSGVQLNDGQAGLHIDPLQFLGRLLHAWNPLLALGTHTGFWVPYQTPYSWVYGIAQVLHVPQDFAQHAAVFLVYLGCLWSMYYCLRSVAPWLDEIGRIAGSCAYLFNMYVALNSQAQIVWLLTYGTLPAMVGVLARAIRGEMNVWRASLAIALLVLVGAGVNPPLVAINVAILAIFVVVTIAFDPKPSAAFGRAVPAIAAAVVATLAINLYWVVPFVDYFRGVWLNGVLSEAPSMHNAATSFSNVLRGLGHWATFVSFAGRAYFPWASAYESGLFGALLWFVPIVALAGIALRRNQRPVTLFFLLVTILSVPIVVGYYHDDLGYAVTTPIYDQFYRNFPGFQMFRFSYKWVAGVEFGLSGLYALAVFAIVSALREYVAKLGTIERRSWGWVLPAVRTTAIALPVLIFVPVVITKMNYPGQTLPSWEYRERSLVGADLGRRVALFPTQFLEQFDWGAPEFYIEDSLIDRPIVYGLLGSEPSEGTDMWVRRAYRATREGLPFSADMFRAMGVDTILQRDDFIPAIDFSSPGEWRYNSTTLTHDLIHRVVGASPVRSDGPLRVYHLGGALPLFYGVTHPVISTVPTFTDGYLGDVNAMAKGQAQFSPPSRSADEFSTTMQSLSPILPASPDQVRDLAVNQALPHGIRVHPPSADAAWITTFDAKGGVYSVFALEQSLLFDRPPPQSIVIDGKYLQLESSAGAWAEYGNVGLAPGKHSVSDGYLDPDLVVAIVGSDDLRSWEDRITALERALPANRSTTALVYGPQTQVTVPVTGRYRLRATGIGPFGPDGLVRATARPVSAAGGFPARFSDTLPYLYGAGVMTTSALMMPPRWYSDDPTVYQWQRGDPIAWSLFARHAHVRVFVPGTSAVRTNVSMRVSRLQVADAMTVRVKGSSRLTVTLPGAAGTDQQYDTIDQLDGPTPQLVHFALDLQPGWNDVVFNFAPNGSELADLGPDVISAAVAPDLTFAPVGGAPAASAPVADRSLRAYAVQNPSTLSGDPELLGNVSGTRDGGAALAVALTHRGATAYRLFPIARDGSFDISFMHAFPNDWNDASQRIVGLWLIARDPRAKFTALNYNRHALPGENLSRPQSLATVPVLVDGKPAGERPVLLTRGTHRIATADRQVRIGLLSVAPADLPRTRDFDVVWQRRSPTAIDVSPRATGSPFLLVFGEAYHPEWRATLDGSVLPHVVVNGVSNGWLVSSLPAGSHITLTFTGQEYYVIADAVSVLALIVMIVLAWAPELWPIGSSNR